MSIDLIRKLEALDDYHVIVSQHQDGTWYFYDSDVEVDEPANGEYYSTIDAAANAAYLHYPISHR
jgi:hypothetical protein